jgi:tetratricopeptide (TPR) repeat protein|tara:strand:+ start:8378 stop:8698 length:321 start_codon:yes stop_codon:yes gene_type:complete
MANNERIEQIKTFLMDTPNDPFLSYALAIEYVSLGQDAAALKLFLELVSTHTDYYATYYHLGKLYERMQLDLLAESIYKQGIAITKRLNQRHAQGELQGAYEELTF